MSEKQSTSPQHSVMTWDEFDEVCVKLASKIEQWNLNEEGDQWEIKQIYGVPKGGLVVAVKLSHLLDIPFILDENQIDTHTLIVSDVSNTGKTLKKYKHNIKVTLYYHQETISPPEFSILEKKDKWILFPWEANKPTSKTEKKV